MSEDIRRVMDMAAECGFTASGPLDPRTIVLRQEVRDMCAEGKCNAYGHNWTCPPACGDLDACRARINLYSKGVILQTTGELEDSMDYEAMMDTSAAHKRNFLRLIEKVLKEWPDSLGLAAGGCTVCKKCRYPEPCIHPEKAFSSMEGYGMVVSEVCRSNGMKYYYGENTITYVACVLLK